MRIALLLSALALPALAQDAPETPTPVFNFSVVQGWSLTADAEADFPDIQENGLVAGLTPRFKPPITPPEFPTRDRDNRVRPRGRSVRVVRTNRDPLKLEGTIALLPDGAVRPRFRRLEYWDRTQRYWMEFGDDKIRTCELGGLEKWSGSRLEWAARLDKLEIAFLDAYLKVMTPQRPGPAKDKIGLDGLAAPEPAWRLFVSTSLEEQIAVLILARLDGAFVRRGMLPLVAGRYPERSVAMARALLDRLLAQADGSFAPEAARVRPGRPLKDQAWLGTEIAVPSLSWTDGRAWTVERLKPFEEARRRLRAIADESNRTGLRGPAYLDPDAWRSAVEDEAKALRKHFGPEPAPAAASMEDALLPRTRAVGPATYDFREKSELKDGALSSSDVDVHGTGHDVEVFFFHSGTNAWRTSFVQVETWYKGKLTRE